MGPFANYGRPNARPLPGPPQKATSGIGSDRPLTVYKNLI